MSRARGTSHVDVVADDADQAVEDLGAEWRREARQRWVLDTDEVAEDGPRRPDLARRTDSTLRITRLRAVRDAVAAVAPDAEDRLRVLDAQLRLERVAQPKPARALGRRRRALAARKCQVGAGPLMPDPPAEGAKIRH